MNYQGLEIEDESESPADNIGKRARILLVNEKEENKWIETQSWTTAQFATSMLASHVTTCRFCFPVRE